MPGSISYHGIGLRHEKCRRFTPERRRRKKGYRRLIVLDLKNHLGTLTASFKKIESVIEKL
jgi:hypothetical protein